MTAQFPEELKFDGKLYDLFTNPLSVYFELEGVTPKLFSPHTGLWRGYVGTWEILNDRLYLVGIEGIFETGEDVTLESLFPGFPDRVFAHWFSGVLRIPMGECLDYVHGGYMSTYERDILISVEDGVVTGKEEKENTLEEQEGLQF